MTFPHKFRGMLSMVLAMGVFIGSDSCMKFALRDMPLFELVLMRGISGVLFCLLLVFMLGHGRDLPGFSIRGSWHAAPAKWWPISPSLLPSTRCRSLT